MKINKSVPFIFLLLGGCRGNVDVKESMEVGTFLQKIQTTITSADVGSGLLSNDIRDILVTADGQVWVATAAGVCSTFDGQGWHPYVDGAPGADNAVIALTSDAAGNIWAGTAGVVKKLDGQVWTAYGFTQSGLTGSLTTILGSSQGGIWVGTDKGFAYFDGGDFQVKGGISTTSFAEGPDGSLWRGTDSGLHRLSSGSRTFTVQDGLLSNTVRALALDDEGRIWAGTDRGISIYDPKASAWSQITGTTGLPYTDITRLTFTPDGELLAGTSWGAVLKETDRWHYFAGLRWVPSNRIAAAAAGADKTIWLGTPKGIGRIVRVPVTLEDKARHYEDDMRARHNRMGMFASVGLSAPGDLEHFFRYDTDNDGLWTQMYIAAESFRYAATHDPEAKRNARESFEAMLRLEQFPRENGNPGFHARSFVAIDEVIAQFPTCATLTPVEICTCKEPLWTKAGAPTLRHWGPDVTGNFCWKRDTSSDEITGHMFGYSVYYDLAADEEEKKEVRAVVSRLMNHIVDHGYQLWDLDGTPTRFGRWDPEHVSEDELKIRIGGVLEDAGAYWMDGLEILSYLKAAYHITGDKKFQDSYQNLIKTYRYDYKAARWQNIFLLDPRLYNYSDDELAFLAYYPLLVYERDPVQGKVFVDSVERVRQSKDPQRNPLWNFIAGVRMERGYGLQDAVGTLKEFPWSFVTWRMLNSQRTDVTIWLTTDRFLGTNLQSTVALPYDERVVELWNSNPYELDGGGPGNGEESFAPWLLPYWMGKYYGFIK